jgi:hypothetical protein
MAEVVVATLNVSFGEDTATTQGNLKLELDDREDGLNGGDTSFAPGDDAYFFLFKDANVDLITTTPITTAGGVSAASDPTGTKAIDENISFSNSDTSSLGYPPDGAVDANWLGKSYRLSGTTLIPDTTKPNIIGSELKMEGGKKMIGILNCKYNSTGSLWKLSNVPQDFKEAMVIAIGTY